MMFHCLQNTFVLVSDNQVKFFLHLSRVVLGLAAGLAAHGELLAQCVESGSLFRMQMSLPLKAARGVSSYR